MTTASTSVSPNLYWRSIQAEQLHGHASYVALPDVETLTIVGTQTHRFVRQDSPLWSELHAGVLTTGSLKEALGFREAQAGKLLGIKHDSDHRQLISAYHNLRQPAAEVIDPQPEQLDAAAIAEIINRNEATVADFNAARRSAAAQAAAAAAAAASCVSAPSKPHARSSSSSGKRCAKAAAAVAAQGAGSDDAQQAARAALDAYCRKVAANGGFDRLRMKWGMVHEPAALHAVLCLFPSSLLHEVGLFRVALSSLPKAWGFTSANLPPLGASPDGLIIHTVLAPAHQVRCLVAADQALKQGAANAQHDAAQLNQLRFQAQQTVRELLKLVAVACPAGSDAASAGSGASAGGSDGEEAATAGQACQHPAAGQRSRQPDEEEDDENEEIILYRMVELSSAPSAQGGARTPEKQPAAGKQRARGAQPASSSQQAAAATLRAAQSESSAADAVRAALNGLQRINLADAAAGPRNGDRSHGSSALDPAAPAATNGTKAHAAAAAAAPNRRQPPSAPVQQSRPGMEEALAPVVLREIVEIKNTFPYGRRNRRSGAKGKTISEYIVSDRGPRERVDPSWVPQLQLHMLAAGTWSGLLVSRSATKGVRVFRMYRDDEYLLRMLRIISRFYTQHVLPGVPPPHDMFIREPEYRSFLAATLRLAAGAATVVHCLTAIVPPGSDTRAFV